MVNKYSQKNKEKLCKEQCERCQNFSAEQKGKRWKKPWNGYKNLSEEEKQNKVEYTRNDYLGRNFLEFYKVPRTWGLLSTNCRTSKSILTYGK